MHAAPLWAHKKKTKIMNSNLAEEFAKANAISSEMSPEEAAETTPPPPRAHRKQPTKQGTMNKKNPIQVDDEEETEEAASCAIKPNRPANPLPPAPPAATSPIPILPGAASGSEKNEKKKRKRVRFVDDEPGQVTEPAAAPPAPAAPTEKKRKPNPNPSRCPRCESSDTERKQLWSRDVRKYREGGPFYKCGVVISIKRDKGKGKFSGTVVVDVKREHVKRAQTARHSQPMRGILSRAVTLRDHL